MIQKKMYICIYMYIFRNQITCQILVQIISNFNSVWKQFKILFHFFFSYRNAIHWKKKGIQTLNIEVLCRFY